DTKNRGIVLAYAGPHLAALDPDVSAEAYLEFARAGDADVLAAARLLAPDRLRRLLDDPATPADRLNLLAYLMVACGGPPDVPRFEGWLREPGARFRGALGGLYAGLLLLAPERGWRAVTATLADGRRPFIERNAALAAVRFHHNANPTAYRAPI